MRCVNGHFEEGLVDPVVFAAVVRLVHALHAEARAIAMLDSGLRLALETPEVEVLLERADEEVVDDERECCLLVLNLVSSTLPCIRRPRPRLRVLDVCGFV